MPSRLANHGRLVAWTSVQITTITNTMSNSWSLPGTWSTTGIVATTIGTAPRSPAHDRNTCSRHCTRNHVVVSATEAGRATSSNAAPTPTAGQTRSPSRDGVTSSPSSTNNPIWANQASPSAKPRVAGPCGSPELPRTTAAT